MAGEIDRLPLIDATHGIGHDADGFAGRFVLAGRPVRTTATGAVRRDASGRARGADSGWIAVTPLLKEVA